MGEYANRCAKPFMNVWVNAQERTKERMREWANGDASAWARERAGEFAADRTNGGENRRTSGWVNGRMVERENEEEWMSECIIGRVDAQVN